MPPSGGREPLRHPRTCREGGGCGEREQSCCTPSSRFFPAFRREPLHKRGGPSTLGSSPRAALKLLSFAVTQAARLSRSRHPGPGSPRWSANTRSARREDPLEMRSDSPGEPGMQPRDACFPWRGPKQSPLLHTPLTATLSTPPCLICSSLGQQRVSADGSVKYYCLPHPSPQWG